ncbi:Six-hairpin glycosidase [Rhizoclosmatium globosum]|uniref:glucan 1,4-alpha-glucosidase n=1 Tax=Rhizoclosmatium globosum TaxID=329046 RepID=A0A1Y2C1Y6_9FUNG|nr:Six-hairpin glycosidase [Rhizoclosmatium globosum]|eukprot:ORY40914.1 Six-hairpin glycosidase [Rhizoclosmatium globosum]
MTPLSLLLALVVSTPAAMAATIPLDATLNTFVSSQTTLSLQRLQANIQSDGAIAASPSKTNPNYFFHWTRDGALTMKTIVQLYETALKSGDTAGATSYENSIWLYSRHESATQVATDTLGRAKYDFGTNKPETNWASPQNDGPALRAYTLIRFANAYLDIKKGPISAITSNNLYTNAYNPATSIIKRDLEYVASSFLAESTSSPNCELWEEVFARAHIYTRAAQRSALIVGAAFANRMGDTGAGTYYLQIAQQIHNAIISQHWSSSFNYLLNSLDVTNASAKPKPSDLDAGTVLAAIHNRDTVPPTSWGVDITRVDAGEVLLTAMTLASRMKALYNINKNTGSGTLAPGIGRYTEDVYDGYSASSLGNPWFLINNGYAELSYSVASQWCSAGQIPLTTQSVSALNWLVQGGLVGNATAGNVVPSGVSGTLFSCKSNPTFFNTVISALGKAGDAHLRRVKLHLPTTNGGAGDTIGSISEEFNRDTGFMQGAIELTWSHASFLSMSFQRSAAAKLTCACN